MVQSNLNQPLLSTTQPQLLITDLALLAGLKEDKHQKTYLYSLQRGGTIYLCLSDLN